MNEAQKIASKELFDRIINYLHESNAIENISNIDYSDIILQKTLVGHFGAFLDAQELAVNHTPLSLEDLCRWQGWIIKEQIQFGHPVANKAIGKIRSTGLPINVTKGNYGAPSFEEVPALIKKMIEDLNKALAATNNNEVEIVLLLGDFYQRFETIHPFENGNEIVGRILANYIIGWFSFPYIIFRADERQEIYDAHQSNKAMRCFMGKKIQEAIYNSEYQLFLQKENFGLSSTYYNPTLDEKITVEWHDLINAIDHWKREIMAKV